MPHLTRRMPRVYSLYREVELLKKGILIILTLALLIGYVFYDPLMDHINVGVIEFVNP